MEDGAMFTLKSNFQECDDDNELFSESQTTEEQLPFDSENIISPWDKPFAELIPLMKDIGNGLYKKIVKRPVDNVEVKDRCRVKIAYNAYMENESSSFDSSFLRGDYKIFVTGAGEVLVGLELAVRSMKKGEESQFIIPYEHLFGEQGCEPRIKKKADALFVIQLIDFSGIGDEAATDNVNTEDRSKYSVMIEKILEVKTSGIDNFRQGNYVKAAASFHRAINKLELCRMKSEEEEKQCNEHLITLYVNVMVCYNKLNRPKQVCSAFRDLTRLTDTSKHAKALFSHGQALITLGEFVRAKDALKRAYRLKPNDMKIAELLKTVDKKHSNHKAMESNLWRKAFGNDEPATSQECSVEVSESFKLTIKDIVTAFNNDPAGAKKNIPIRLTKDEESYIKDFVKGFNMKLVQNVFQGSESCYLIKQKDL